MRIREKYNLPIVIATDDLENCKKLSWSIISGLTWLEENFMANKCKGILIRTLCNKQITFLYMKM